MVFEKEMIYVIRHRRRTLPEFPVYLHYNNVIDGGYLRSTTYLSISLFLAGSLTLYTED